MGKYPNKGMNALAKERPEVAKKIMGYDAGGVVMTPAQRAMDKNKDGKVSSREEKEYLEMMKREENDRRMPQKRMGGGHVKKYGHGGSVKKYSNGGMACKHRPDGIRGGGCAEGGMKFTGTK